MIQGLYGELYRAKISAEEDGWLRLTVTDRDGKVTIDAAGTLVFERRLRGREMPKGNAVGVWVPAGRSTQFGLPRGTE